MGNIRVDGTLRGDLSASSVSLFLIISLRCSWCESACRRWVGPLHSGMCLLCAMGLWLNKGKSINQMYCSTVAHSAIYGTGLASHLIFEPLASWPSPGGFPVSVILRGPLVASGRECAGQSKNISVL